MKKLLFTLFVLLTCSSHTTYAVKVDEQVKSALRLIKTDIFSFLGQTIYTSTVLHTIGTPQMIYGDG